MRFLWSGDTAGQGWGISNDFGGMKIYEVMRALNPDFFIHCGDTIYADGPILPEVKLADGGVWRNHVLTEEKSKVDETLKEFRGSYRYNQLDANVRRFNSRGDAGLAVGRPRGDEQLVRRQGAWRPTTATPRRTCALLIARGTRAFLENAPMRWYAQQEEERVYRQIAWGPLLDVFVIDMRSYRGPEHAQPAGLDRRRDRCSSGRSSSPGCARA